MLGVLFGTMAMIIVLSVFNGFDDKIQNIYKDVDSDIKIVFKEGALFSIDQQKIKNINTINGVNYSSEILEYKMLAQYLDYQSIINVKGIDNNYNEVTNLKNHIILGKKNLMASNFCIVGRGLFNNLSLKLLDFENPLKLSYFNENDKNLIYDPIKSRAFYTTAIFSTQTEIDYNNVFVNIEDLRREGEVGFFTSISANLYAARGNRDRDYYSAQLRFDNNSEKAESFLILQQSERKSNDKLMDESTFMHGRYIWVGVMANYYQIT